MIKIHEGNYREVLSHVKANLIFTSPPYNIGSKAERKDGRRKLGEYDPKSYGAIRDYPDSLPEADYQTQQLFFFLWAHEHLAEDGVLVYNHKPRRNGHMIHPSEWFLRQNNLVLMEEVVWDRGSTHNHCPQMIWQQTERLYVFKKAGEKYRLDNRTSGDVWYFPKAKANGHAAPFPVELATRVIKLWSAPGDLICDPYSGSGTVALAAKQLDRRFEGSEILAKYARLAQERVK